MKYVHQCKRLQLGTYFNKSRSQVAVVCTESSVVLSSCLSTLQKGNVTNHAIRYAEMFIHVHLLDFTLIVGQICLHVKQGVRLEGIGVEDSEHTIITATVHRHFHTYFAHLMVELSLPIGSCCLNYCRYYTMSYFVHYSIYQKKVTRTSQTSETSSCGEHAL